MVTQPVKKSTRPDQERLGVGLDHLHLHLGEVQPVLLGERLEEDLAVGLHADGLALEVLRLGLGVAGVRQGDVAVGAPLEERAHRDDVDRILGQPGLEDVVAAGRDPERRLAGAHDGHGVLARAPVHDAVPDALLGEEALGLGDHDGSELAVPQPARAGSGPHGSGEPAGTGAAQPPATSRRASRNQQGRWLAMRGGLLHSGRERANSRKSEPAALVGAVAAGRRDRLRRRPRRRASRTMRAMAGPHRR